MNLLRFTKVKPIFVSMVITQGSNIMIFHYVVG